MIVRAFLTLLDEYPNFTLPQRTNAPSALSPDSATSLAHADDVIIRVPAGATLMGALHPR